MYLLLTILISRLKLPNSDIDTFLEPTMEEPDKLWEKMAEVVDASQNKFTLKAIMFVRVTISLV